MIITYDAEGRPVPPGPLPPSIQHSIPKAGHYQSLRFDDAGHEAAPLHIIVHNTEASDDSVAWLSWESNPPASIHCISQRDGTRSNIVHYADTAWHTGYARAPYHGWNTLGIELANESNHWGRAEPYPDEQLWTAAHCVATWCFSYGIPLDHIKKHTEIAVWPPAEAGKHKPGDLRRYDPSNFPWSLFMSRVVSWLEFFDALDPKWHPYFII